MNRGAYLLRRTGNGDETVGAACGVSRQAVGCWKSGQKRPGPDARGKLEAAYGIPRTAWDESEDGPSSEVENPDTAPEPAPAMPSRLPEPVAAALNVSARSFGAAARADYLERELQQTLAFLAADKKTTPVERMKALALAAQIEDKIASLRGEKELTNMRIVQLPFWRRICESSAETLAPWPEAARAYAVMVRRLEREAQLSAEPAKVA